MCIALRLSAISELSVPQLGRQATIRDSRPAQHRGTITVFHPKVFIFVQPQRFQCAKKPGLYLLDFTTDHYFPIRVPN